MKKCYHFPTWEEQKDAMISLDEKTILFVNAVKTNLYGLTQIIEHNQDSLIIAKKIARDGLETMIIEQSTPSDPILAKLCELTGAKMYGDYIVLDCFFQKTRFLEHFIGDLCKCVISFIVTKEDKEYICIAKKDNNISNHFGYYTIRKKEQLPILDYMGACDRFEDIIKIYNIFQEYSKFLRKEESKWEEVKKIVL